MINEACWEGKERKKISRRTEYSERANVTCKQYETNTGKGKTNHMECTDGSRMWYVARVAYNLKSIFLFLNPKPFSI